jgi:hypothetical protein
MLTPRSILEPPEGSKLRARALTDGVLIDFPRVRPSLRSPLIRLCVILMAASAPGLILAVLLALFLGARLFLLLIMLPFALLFLGSAVALILLEFWRILLPGAQPIQVSNTIQLAVADGILVRKKQIGRKDVWAGDEISDIRFENYWEGPDLLIGVVLHYADDEPVILHGGILFNQASDLEREEYEWLAAQLRRALEIPDDPLAPAPLPPTVVSADAIIAKSPHVRPGE